VFNGPVGNVTSTSLSLPLGRYYWRVIASSDAGPSEPSAESQFDIVSTCGVPTAPSALVASVFGGLVSLIWQAPALGAVTAYVVEVGSGPGLVDRYNVRTATAQPQISGHVPGGTYYIRVRAANSCGVSPASDEIVLSIGSEPQPPRDLTLSFEGALVRITWNVESSTQPVLGFIVEAGSATGLTNLAQFATAQTSLTVGKPGPGVYFIRVRARGFNGLSAPSDEVILVVQ
jgi:hypothetical protein